MSQQDMDLLLWLHAEAVWQREQETARASAEGQAADRYRDDSELALWLYAESEWKRSCVEASRRDWAAEADRLRRELEFEANGANTFAGADAVAERGRNGVAFAVEDFGLDVDTDAGGVYISLNHRPAARTEAWGDDVNVDYDADGIPTGVEILRRPGRAVHPEADRAGEVDRG